MTLDELTADVESTYAEIDDEVTVALDRQTKNELAVLQTTFGTDDTAELVRRGIHLLFQSTVETGGLDLNLRRTYDVTYDEYLSGMTFEQMTGGTQYPQPDDERRYQF